MPEQVNKDIIRFAGRNLITTAEKSPLKRFIGTLSEWDIKLDSNQNNQGNNNTLVVFNFSNVEVLELQPNAEAYIQDTAEIQLKYSHRERSGFGFFLSSLNQALGISSEDSNLDLMKARNWLIYSERYNWGKIPGSTTADENGDTWGDIWKVEQAPEKAVVVAAPATPATIPPAVVTPPVAAPPVTQTAMDVVLGILDGKTLAEATPDIVTNVTVQADATVMGQVMDGTLITSLMASGKLTVDDGGRYARLPDGIPA